LFIYAERGKARIQGRDRPPVRRDKFLEVALPPAPFTKILIRGGEEFVYSVTEYSEA